MGKVADDAMVEGGATRGESTSCVAKSLVSISKIHVLSSNLRILSPRMLATCSAKQIYAAAFFG
jgi:hypothetical protein